MLGTRPAPLSLVPLVPVIPLIQSAVVEIRASEIIFFIVSGSDVISITWNLISVLQLKVSCAARWGIFMEVKVGSP